MGFIAGGGEKEQLNRKGEERWEVKRRKKRGRGMWEGKERKRTEN